jgi:hypothetical protein
VGIGDLKMFKVYYNKDRFRFIHEELIKSKYISSYSNQVLIKKTACFYSDNLNVYIDTSDGVNEDLEIQEYCGRIKKIVNETKGKRFLFFKAAYSTTWSKNIEAIANKNNGKVIPFFKWSFNNNFYSHVYGKKEKLIKALGNQKKQYDVGIFFSNKPYIYPKPSVTDPLISWSDHSKFNLKGTSINTGHYNIESRRKIIDLLINSDFKIKSGGFSYEDYIKESFKCKVVINPPGIGEYTSRMIDQSYLGNCIVLRKNSYDNGLTWKNNIPEIDFKSKNWESDLKRIVDNFKYCGELCEQYFNQCWNSKSIVRYLEEKINDNLF